jgi:hypothetical protein
VPQGGPVPRRESVILPSNGEAQGRTRSTRGISHLTLKWRGPREDPFHERNQSSYPQMARPKGGPVPRGESVILPSNGEAQGRTRSTRGISHLTLKWRGPRKDQIDHGHKSSYPEMTRPQEGPLSPGHQSSYPKMVRPQVDRFHQGNQSSYPKMVRPQVDRFHQGNQSSSRMMTSKAEAGAMLPEPAVSRRPGNAWASPDGTAGPPGVPSRAWPSPTTSSARDAQ